MLKYLLIIVLLFTSCATTTYDQADKLMADKYLPMLTTYIDKDSDVVPELKEVHKLAISRWLDLIRSR